MANTLCNTVATAVINNIRMNKSNKSSNMIFEYL